MQMCLYILYMKIRLACTYVIYAYMFFFVLDFLSLSDLKGVSYCIEIKQYIKFILHCNLEL